MAFRELLRTNDAVLLSFVEALLRERRIGHVVFDANMSVLEGSLGILPRRVLVENDGYRQAVRILVEAGLDSELKEQKLTR
jgi:Putative prokaryotic signal transducing protein